MRIPDSPPVIKPLPAGTHRPQWSVMIPVYNCAPFLPILLESVLMQAFPEDEMQIEVIDDCSTDGDIKKIVEDIGKGRVGYYRQPQNVGSLRNFETCLNRSRGHLIHLLHGDDRLLPGFYTEMTATFAKFPQIGSAFCAHHHIDSVGNVRYQVDDKDTGPYILQNWLEILAERQRPQYVAMVVKRSVYEHLGAFYGVVYGEDWEMWARVAKYYKVAYNPKVLAQYRQHEESISGSSYETGKNIKDIAWVIERINSYLPDDKKKRLKNIARRNYAYYAFNRKYYLWQKNHNNQPGLKYFSTILKMHSDPRLLAKMAKFKIQMSVYNFRKTIGL